MEILDEVFNIANLNLKLKLILEIKDFLIKDY